MLTTAGDNFMKNVAKVVLVGLVLAGVTGLNACHCKKKVHQHREVHQVHHKVEKMKEEHAHK
ncbi:MAG: hypothetical protein JWM09_967 [Francisellaceae bacterium]|nr:hypothetical protein [Francisellaceae bacterium]